MQEKQPPLLINVDPDTLEIAITGRKESPMAIPTTYGDADRMPPMWEAVYFHYMYSRYHLRQEKRSPRQRRAACLAPPPVWLVAIAAVMWEGIIQGATWNVVKIAVGAAISKLRVAGLTPPTADSRETAISVQAGWREYSTSGKKQYEFFLSLKRTIRTLPDRYAIAYARAANETEFGSIVRNDSKVHPAKALNSPPKTQPRARPMQDREKA